MSSTFQRFVPGRLSDRSCKFADVDLYFLILYTVSQLVSLGEFRGNQLPKFASAAGVRFVQILNVCDHWLCVTNVFGSPSHEV